MSWRHPTPQDHDHAHDLRKHDTPPHRLDRKISTAEDIAICVRALDGNVLEAAALIEQYAQMVASIALAEAAEKTAKRLETM